MEGPLFDPVMALVQTPFRSWSLQHRLDLVKEHGRPTPKLNGISFHHGKKSIVRHFNPNWYEVHRWLCGSFYENKLYCWPCLLFGQRGGPWNTSGFGDPHNFTRGVQKHQQSKDHIHSSVALKRFENDAVNVADPLTTHNADFKKFFNERVRLNRLVLEHLIDIALVLAKTGSPFHGNNEGDLDNRGNFVEHFEVLMDRAAPEVRAHYASVRPFFSGPSKTIQNELIDSILVYLSEKIDQDIEKCEYFSVEVDDMTDITHNSLCSIILRYVDKKGVIRERFLGFHDVSGGRDAESLFNLVSSVLSPLFDVRRKLVGQGYDGACVMAGHLNDLQAKIRSAAPQAVFLHCSAHSLNLVLEKGCASNEKFRIYFQTIAGIPTFFHNSTKRTDQYDKILDRRIPTVAPARWGSRSKIVSMVNTYWNPLKEVFVEINNDNTSPDAIIAKEHVKNLESFEFAFLTAVFSSIFEITDKLYENLHDKMCDVHFCWEKIQQATSRLANIRNDDCLNTLIECALEKTGPPESRSFPKSEDGFGCVLHGFDAEYKSSYFEAIDNITTQMNERFGCYERCIFLGLADMSRSSEYSKKFPDEALKSLFSTFNLIFHEEDFILTRNEIMELYEDDTYAGLSLPALIQKMNEDDMKTVLPQAYNVMTLIATLSPISVTFMKSFPLVSSIKNYLRNTIGQERLNALCHISLEKEFLDDLKRNDPHFYERIIDIFASQKSRRIDLFYKT